MPCWGGDQVLARERARRREGSGSVGVGTNVGPACGIRSRADQAHRGPAHGDRHRPHPGRAGPAERPGTAVGRGGHDGDGRDLRRPGEAALPAGRDPCAGPAGGARLDVAGHAAEPTGRGGRRVLRRPHLLRRLRTPVRRPRHRPGPGRLPDLLPLPVRARDAVRAARPVRGHRRGVRLQRRRPLRAAAADPGGHPGPAAQGLPGPARAADHRSDRVAGRGTGGRGEGPGAPAHRHRASARDGADDPGAAGGRPLGRGDGAAAAAPDRRRRDRIRAARSAAAHRAQRRADGHPHPAPARRSPPAGRRTARRGRGDLDAAPGPGGAAPARAAAGGRGLRDRAVTGAQPAARLPGGGEPAEGRSGRGGRLPGPRRGRPGGARAAHRPGRAAGRVRRHPGDGPLPRGAGRRGRRHRGQRGGRARKAAADRTRAAHHEGRRAGGGRLLARHRRRRTALQPALVLGGADLLDRVHQHRLHRRDPGEGLPAAGRHGPRRGGRHRARRAGRTAHVDGVRAGPAVRVRDVLHRAPVLHADVVLRDGDAGAAVLPAEHLQHVGAGAACGGDGPGRGLRSDRGGGRAADRHRPAHQ